MATEPANKMAEGETSRQRSRESAELPKNTVKITIYGQDGTNLGFEVKKDVPMRKLFLKYCERNNMEYSAVNFLINGSRVRVRSTPAQLGLKDGVVIEAMVHRNGGGDRKGT